MPKILPDEMQATNGRPCAGKTIRRDAPPLAKKYWIRYIYQPFFMTSLGVFGKMRLPSPSAIPRAIPSSFRLWNISLNG